MFNYFYYSYYYPLPFFLNSIFSFFLIICLGIATPFITKLANKNENYKNKKIFIIYEKAISILLILHIILTLINFILINFIFNLIIGGLGVAMIYGITYNLDENNITIDKLIINKISYYIKNIIKNIIKIIVPIIAPIIIPICILIFIFYEINYNIDLQSFLEIINNNINSEYIPILVAIFCLVFILIFVVIMINSMIVIINQKLNKIIKNIENNKSASSSEVETTKKDNKDNDYII